MNVSPILALNSGDVDDGSFLGNHVYGDGR